LRQIADELGVDYLLTGTVRWAKAADGTSRVQVSPELVEIGDGTARSRWQQPFDAPLTDVFQVQGNIAGQVATALNVALGVADEQELAERPTTNLAAYDSYLRAVAIQGIDGVSLRRKISLLEDAVARDSTFGIAWALLARTQTGLLTGRPPRNEIVALVQRAMTYAPNAPETFHARANLMYLPPANLDSVMSIAQAGVARYPGDPELLRVKGSIEAIVGHPDSALATLRRSHALDPRSLPTTRALGLAFTSMHRYAESRATYVSGLAVDSSDLTTLQALVATYLFEGNLTGARAQIARVSSTTDRRQFYAYLAMYDDLYWVLTPEQQDTVLTLPVSYFDDDAPSRAYARAEIYRQRGDSVAMRAWADSAERLILPLIRDASSDPQFEAILGVVQAYQGDKVAAVRSTQRALDRARRNDSTFISYESLLAVRARAITGDLDGALAGLEASLAGSTTITPAMLPLIPDLQPLRGQPRFEALARHH
jgi:Flp pilus assembly protein TadD